MSLTFITDAIFKMDNQKVLYKKRLPLTMLALFISQVGFGQRVVHYDLYVKDTVVNYAGKEKKAIAVNGSGTSKKYDRNSDQKYRSLFSCLCDVSDLRLSVDVRWRIFPNRYR